MITPYVDRATNMVYLNGKGEAFMKYYEFIDRDPYLLYINTYKSTTPLTYASFFPKHLLKPQDKELMRMIKLGSGTIQHVSFVLHGKVFLINK